MTTSMIDVDIPRFTQAFVAVTVAVAFVFQQAWLVAATAALLVASRYLGPRAPLALLYVKVVRPWLRPDGSGELEPAGPPRFAQGLGATVLGVATVAFLVGADAVGWGLSLLVVALASLAAATRICVGCLVYRKVVSR